MLKTKIATIGLSLAFVLSAAAPAGAVTIAELQAQINALMAQLAALQGGSVSTGTQFTSDMTVGSTGSQVVALQSMLVAQGHLVMPAGVAMGYFGSLTQAAVAKWQAANGVAPAVGYFGPISRAKANASGGATGTVPGATVGGSVTVGGSITTPGVEGTITVENNSTPAGVKLRENSSRVAVAGIEIEAKTSDMRVERVKLDLDAASGSNTDQQFYNKIASRVYVMEGSTVLASMDLDSSTVVEDGTDRFITISGFGLVVPRDTKKVLTIALDAKNSWDTEFDGDSWTIGVPIDGVRSVDGAGVNQYGPSTAFTRSFTSEGDIVDDAELRISLSVDTPKVSEVIADTGTDEDEIDGLELMKFEVRAEDDSVEITDLDVVITRGGSGTATTSTLYLKDGNTTIGSETGTAISATGGTVTFDDIDYVVPEDSTRTLRVTADIDDANSSATTFKAVVSSLVAENSVGDNVVETGTATGNTITLRNVGLEVTLLSKSITKDPGTEQNNLSTSTAEATFNLRVKAVGGDIKLGQVASTTGAFVQNDGDTSGDAPSFIVYQNGSNVTATLAVASSTNFTIPTAGTTADGTETRLLAEGASIDFPVSFLFQGRTGAGVLVSIGSYAIGLEQLNWVSSGGLQTSTFMAGELDWRTTTVSMP